MKILKSIIAENNISVKSLSKKTGLSLKRLEDLINEVKEPSILELKKISYALDLPLNYFLSEDLGENKIYLLFRNEIKDKHKIIDASKYTALINNFLILLDDYVPESSVLKFNVANDSFKDANNLAAEFREQYLNNDQVSPIFNLHKILTDKLKFFIYISEFGADGASAFLNQIPFIFISPRSDTRMLFSIAHELGHILGHFNKIIDSVHYDSRISILGSRNQQHENFANTFAACLLLPDEGLGIALKTIRNYLNNKGALGDLEILFLSRLYGVSFDVAAMRCETLSLLPSGGARALSSEIKKKYSSAEKRANQLNLLERTKIDFPKLPSFVIDNAINKISKGDISVGKAAQILTIPVSKIYNQHIPSLNA